MFFFKNLTVTITSCFIVITLTTSVVNSKVTKTRIDCKTKNSFKVRPEVVFGLNQLAKEKGFDFESVTWTASPDLAVDVAYWICHFDDKIKSVDLVTDKKDVQLLWNRKE